MTDDWREMDSVPKDGSFVLLCNVHHGRVVVAAWATVDRIREDMPWWEDGDGGWIDREAGNPEPITAYYNPLYFQAWQSLPEPRRLERQPFDLERFLQDDSNLPAWHPPLPKEKERGSHRLCSRCCRTGVAGARASREG